MNTDLMPEVEEVIQATDYTPAVSIIVPFEPKMSPKSGLVHSLKIIADKVEDELRKTYPPEVCRLMMQKIGSLINDLDYSTYKKSIAIYVSPVFQKVLYLDMPVKEKVIIDDSFEIRDLLYCKKQIQQSLVLLLSRNQSRIYVARANRFDRVVLKLHQSNYSYLNEEKEKVLNFTDISSHREVLTNKFLLHIDHALDIILKAYRLPLFVFATEKIIGHFKQITRHNEFIVEFIPHNCMDTTAKEMEEILRPHIADWNNVKERDIINQLEAAAGRNKLAIGLRNVCREAKKHNGRLLLLEKDFVYRSQSDSMRIINKASRAYNKFSYVKDAVGDIIEKVLEYGGDVEFVNKDVLGRYRHIALLQFY